MIYFDIDIQDSLIQKMGGPKSASKYRFYLNMRRIFFDILVNIDDIEVLENISFFFFNFNVIH